jgi:hypothetical protein
MSKNYYTEIVADQNTAELLDGVAFRWFDYGELAAGGGAKGSVGSETTQDFPRLMPRGIYFLARITNLSEDNVYKLFWSELVGEN